VTASRWLPQAASPYVLIAPAAVLLGVFVLAPIVLTAALAFVDWDLLSGQRSWVGLENLERIAASGNLGGALRTTVLYALLTVPVTVAAGLAVAVGISSLRFGGAVWRTAYFLPVASTLAAMAVVWRWLFYPETGLVDEVAAPLLGETGWLSSMSLALPAMAVVGNWHGVGIAAVIFLAGLGGVPERLYDAARMDGAGAWSRFRHVTLPAIRQPAVFAVVIATVASLRAFEQVVVLTGGGPARSTETLAFLLYRRAVEFLDVGGAAVVNLALVALVLPVVVWQVKRFAGLEGRRGG
jgi:multiple sugar transport system permease protein